ncbi:hypothetical protein NIES2107_13590 [Nostoc carneum NIES-2107]|nr:hypothetical protein NIES2107_13590 [Nostoc carneum NIES-2107]
MTAFFKVMVVGVLATAGVLAANTISAIGKEVKTGNVLLAQTPVQSESIALPIALPEMAVINLKKGGSQSGQVIGIDTQGQKLTIQRNKKTYLISLNQIEKVAFRNSAKAYRTDGRIIIRGERQRYTAKVMTWSGLPLDTLRIKNPVQGQAEVKLGPPVVSSDLLSGIQSVAKDRQYVVDQIQFNPQKRTMTIQATPY